jgi:hypothetical protein
MLHADIDDKIEEGLAVAYERINALEMPPTKIVNSGHGMHCYWLLTEPCEPEAIGPLLSRVTNVLAADPKPAHVAALMRLPGSHNTKNGDWIEVRQVGGSGILYELDDLQPYFETLTSVLTPRRTISERARPTNRFAQAAAELGWGGPRVDIDAALAAMAPGNIHNTQLSVTAALMSRGTSIDDTVSTVLAATERVGEPGWDWRREEAAIRRMCESWLPKMKARRECMPSMVGRSPQTTDARRPFTSP